MAKASTLSLFSHSPKSVKGQASFSPLDKSRPFFLLVIGSLLTLTILSAIFYIAFRVRVVNLGYKINQEVHTKESIIEESKRLNLEIARLKSPTRLETEAKETLGLLLPLPHQIVYAEGKTAQELDLAFARIKPLPVEIPAKPEKSATVAVADSPAPKSKEDKVKKQKESAAPGKPAKPAALAQLAPKSKDAALQSPPATAKSASAKALNLPTPSGLRRVEAPAKPAPGKLVALAPAPAAKADKKLSDLDVPEQASAPSGAKKVAQAEKKPLPAKPAPEVKKAPAQVKKPVSEKPVASNLLVAKIVPEKSPVLASNAKSLQEKKKSPARESVPAVMLDSMP